MESSYNTAIDIWALGTVAAEMAMCVNKSSPGNTKLERRVLFPGSSCFPLTPCDDHKKQNKKLKKGDAKVNIVTETDQLKTILDTLGKQTDHDLSFVTEDSIFQYLSQLSPNYEKVNFQKIFPWVDKQLAELI